MSVEQEINDLNSCLKNAYNECVNKKAQMPAVKNAQNLAPCIATIDISSGEGGGSTSDNYNVFVQSFEPETKNGVWIKNDNESGDVYFSQNMTSQGEFINSSIFSFLDTATSMRAQCIVGDYLYVFGQNNSTSYKINMRTKQKEDNLSLTTTLTSLDNVYAYPYGNDIFVIGKALKSGGGNSLGYFIYHPNENTSDDWVQFVSPNNTNQYHCITGKYNNEIYIYYSAYYNSYGYKLNLETKTFSSVPHVSGLPYTNNTSQTVSTIAIGEYLYVMKTTSETATGGALHRIKMGSSGTTTVLTLPTTGAIYGAGNFLYCFPYGIDQTTYYRYDIENDLWETKTSIISFSITFPLGNAKAGNNLQTCVYDELTGLLYLRTTSVSTTAFQFEKAPNDLEDGTVVIVESFGGKPTLIQDSSNLAVGISDVAIVEDGELNGDLIVYFGDGEKWNFVKGKVRVTLDMGEEISYVSATYGQPLPEPSIPSKDGYEFVCWTLSGSEYDFSTPVTEPITLVAQWTELSVTLIDYIESTGTQYIDTGYCAYKTKTEVTFQMPSKASTGYLVASWNDNNNRYYPLCYSSTANGFQTATKENSYTTLGSYDNLVHTVIYNDENNKVYYDGVQKATVSDLSTQTTNSIYLFAMHNASNSAQDFYTGRIMSVKITDKETNTLVRDFKPCKDKQGVYCLYDAVSKECFYNQGTGEFRGSDWQPTYIESSGTQYIDTGIKSTSNIRLETTIYGNYSSVCWYGARKEENSTYLGIYNYNGRFDWLNTSGTGLSYQANPTSGVWHTISHGKSLVIDGVTLTEYNSTEFSTNYNIYLFAGNNVGTIANRSSIKMKETKIYDGDTLVRDYIPALDNSGVACFYDKISETFFYNKGTGTFTVG